MNRPILLLAACLIVIQGIQGQATNTHFSSPQLLELLKGNFNPEDYMSSNVIDQPFEIFEDIVQSVNADSLKSYLIAMSQFQNRNSGSDTLSDIRGLGAAQRWGLSLFDRFSDGSEGRLVNGFLVFDQDICGMERHKNVVSVLPGQGPQKDEVIVVLGHLDSRCEDRCDIDCDADGMEDNGSGSALVLELARVMSKYTFNRTLVFMLTTAEEQGLHGARAFADYCKAEGVKVYAAYNNDVIGGVLCGTTASPPGCPYMNHIDSINVRVYSYGGSNSKGKMLARFLEMEYKKHMMPHMKVANIINIMSPEDRTGRGGDHIPFRENNFATVRFCAANEHGDGNPSQPDYHDRQHTRNDILGLDTDGDMELDSFFVHFNYLARNTMINAGAITSAALGPIPVEGFTIAEVPGGFSIEIDDPRDYGSYLVGARKLTGNEFDSVYYTNKKIDTFLVKEPFWYYINVATIDEDSVQSLFCVEEDIRIRTTSTIEQHMESAVVLLQNNPNPFDDATTFGVVVNRLIDYKKAGIRIYDRFGRQITELPIELNPGNNEVLYDYKNHHYRPGVYHYALWVDDRRVAVKAMVYAY